MTRKEGKQPQRRKTAAQVIRKRKPKTVIPEKSKPSQERKVSNRKSKTRG